jgi:hypothetical protein
MSVAVAHSTLPIPSTSVTMFPLFSRNVQVWARSRASSSPAACGSFSVCPMPSSFRLERRHSSLLSSLGCCAPKWRRAPRSSTGPTEVDLRSCPCSFAQAAGAALRVPGACGHGTRTQTARAGGWTCCVCTSGRRPLRLGQHLSWCGSMEGGTRAQRDLMTQTLAPATGWLRRRTCLSVCSNSGRGFLEPWIGEAGAMCQQIWSFGI